MHSPETTLIASRDGVEVAAHDYGGGGRPTLFVHGTGLVGRMWEPVLDRLPAGAFRPIAVDLRTHGASRTPPDATCTDEDLVADLTAVLDAFGLHDAWAVAHSMGGGTTLLLQANRPGAISRSWVFEPIIFPREGSTEEQSHFVEATRRRRPAFGSRAEALARYGSRPPLDELHPEVLAAYVEHGFVEQPDGTVRLACEPELEGRMFEQFLRLGYGRLGEVRDDVLVAYGDATQEPSGAWATRIADAIPRGTAEAFVGDRHFGCFADLDRVVASLSRWFLDR